MPRRYTASTRSRFAACPSADTRSTCGDIVRPTSSHPSLEAIEAAASPSGGTPHADGSRSQMRETVRSASSVSASRAAGSQAMLIDAVSGNGTVNHEELRLCHLFDRIARTFTSQARILDTAVRHLIRPPGGYVVHDDPADVELVEGAKR